MTDKLRIGKFDLSSDKLGKRDAFHFPAILVTSRECLPPGAEVVFTSQDHVARASDGWHGMVDPFLPRCTEAGDKFWVLINPDSIVSNLSHTFSTNIPELGDWTLDVEVPFDDDDDLACKGRYE